MIGQGFAWPTQGSAHWAGAAQPMDTECMPQRMDCSTSLATDTDAEQLQLEYNRYLHARIEEEVSEPCESEREYG